MSDVMERLNSALSDRYRIERELGQGGMATVYLADDLKHDRKVALKVLKPELAAVLGAERFVVEIKTTAALQHPHILPLFDSGVADGFLYYVMPFIDGETLRSKLDRETQFGIDEAVRITVAVADALDYAHRHGVIHRDIKPENILLHEGRPMVADFGIALAVSAAAGGRMTETGLSLGTPHYMSPEQATAEKEISARSDIYSLASVLYEMLAGQPPHTGASAQQIIMKIITEPAPSVTTLRKSVPLNVAAAVAKALEKLPADRFESAKAFADALGNAAFSTVATHARSGAAAKAPRSPRERALAGAPWVLVAAAAIFIATEPLRSRPAPPPPVTRFTLRAEGDGELRDASGSPVAVSPDGARIVYVGQDTAGTTWLYSRALDRDEPVQIAGTNGAIAPFFSPNGQSLGFQQAGRLKTVSLSGGSVLPVAEAGTNAFAWGTDGFIYYSSSAGLLRVGATGSQPALVVAADSLKDESLRWPDALPAGRGVLVTRVRSGNPTLAVVSLPDGTLHDLGVSGTYPRYVMSGHIAFLQIDGTLFSVPFDVKRLKVTGEITPVVVGVRMGPALPGKLGISRTGTLAYIAGGVGTTNSLIIVAPDGNETVVPAAAQSFFIVPRFSPDGQRVAVQSNAMMSRSSSDLWTYDRRTAALGRLTFDSSSRAPAWMPDGKQLVFLRGMGSVFRIAVDGSGIQDSLKLRALASAGDLRVLPDGKGIVYRTNIPGSSRDIWFTSLDSGSTPRQILRTPFEERGIAVSPDGRWLAYRSNETGTDEIYVRKLEEGSGRWKVSVKGGAEPVWGANGRELYYRTADTIVVVGATLSDEPRFTAPRRVYIGQFFTDLHGVGWSRAPDGSLAFVRSRTEVGAQAITVVMHWFDNLRAAPKGAGR